MSRTYQSVKCDKASPCDLKRQQCIYERLYAEISSRFGLLGEDILSFGNLSELGPQRAVFGSEIAETGDIYTQRADGIMGLGRGDVSIVDQLVEKHVISDSFSLCYGGMDFGGGLMILGGINPPAHMVFTKSDFGHSLRWQQPVLQYLAEGGDTCSWEAVENKSSGFWWKTWDYS